MSEPITSTTTRDQEKINSIKTVQQARKVRIGMMYAAMCAPLLGVAFGFAGMAGSVEPFSRAFPTGSISFQMFELMFGVVVIIIYSLAQGTIKDSFRIFKSKLSWYGVMVAMCGMFGDFLYFASAALVGGAIAGPLASLFGFWGAVITSIVYKEKMRSKWTVIGLVFIVIGLFVASGGANMVAPDGASVHLILVGAIMGLVASIIYGFENFAIAAGSDFMPEEGTLFWRATWACIGCLILNFLVMPHFTTIGYEMFSNPTWWAFAAVTGGAWGVYMVGGMYVGINTAGTTGGGVLASTGFVWATLLSMTVYNAGFSGSVLLGTIILFAGVAVMLIRPSKVISQLR
ncbi:MAG: DMT family transporter [Clostridiales Family XIII bacterium]|jgi:drug/metabolite transporter (DMT)-like permease|nr:DMT family transporter [Clostridiales Family XIII bacterium]